MGSSDEKKEKAMNDEKLKPCPLCKADANMVSFEPDVCCSNQDCPLRMYRMLPAAWQALLRDPPVEKAEAEIATLKDRVIDLTPEPENLRFMLQEIRAAQREDFDRAEKAEAKIRDCTCPECEKPANLNIALCTACAEDLEGEVVTLHAQLRVAQRQLDFITSSNATVADVRAENDRLAEKLTKLQGEFRAEAAMAHAYARSARDTKAELAEMTRERDELQADARALEAALTAAWEADGFSADECRQKWADFYAVHSPSEPEQRIDPVEAARLGYITGHNDTVESRYGDPLETAQDIVSDMDRDAQLAHLPGDPQPQQESPEPDALERARALLILTAPNKSRRANEIILDHLTTERDHRRDLQDGLEILDGRTREIDDLVEAHRERIISLEVHCGRLSETLNDP